jgi:hypothetical protein
MLATNSKGSSQESGFSNRPPHKPPPPHPRQSCGRPSHPIVASTRDRTTPSTPTATILRTAVASNCRVNEGSDHANRDNPADGRRIQLSRQRGIGPSHPRQSRGRPSHPIVASTGDRTKPPATIPRTAVASNCRVNERSDHATRDNPADGRRMGLSRESRVFRMWRIRVGVLGLEAGLIPEVLELDPGGGFRTRRCL